MVEATRSFIVIHLELHKCITVELMVNYSYIVLIIDHLCSHISSIHKESAGS